MRVKKGPKVLRSMKILRLRKAMVPPRPPRPRQLSRKSLMASKDSKENLGKGMSINDVRHFLAIFDQPTMSDDFYHITSDIFSQYSQLKVKKCQNFLMSQFNINFVSI